MRCSCEASAQEPGLLQLHPTQCSLGPQREVRALPRPSSRRGGAKALRVFARFAGRLQVIICPASRGDKSRSVRIRGGEAETVDGRGARTHVPSRQFRRLVLPSALSTVLDSLSTHSWSRGADLARECPQTNGRAYLAPSPGTLKPILPARVLLIREHRPG